MPGGFDLTMPPDRLAEAQSLVAGMQKQGASDDEIAGALRRLGAKDAKNVPPPDDFVAFVRREKQREQDVLNIFAGRPPGMIEPGNIPNLMDRPVLGNPDGSYSTTSSMSFAETPGGPEILIPTVVEGRRLSPKEAIEHYRRTGEHLGKFRDSDSSDAYAIDLHNRQARFVGPPASRAIHEEARAFQSDRPGGMDVAVDPVDALAGGLTAGLKGGVMAGARSAVETGASEAAGAISSRLAGKAGLPPWAQHVAGLAGGLAPMAARPRSFKPTQLSPEDAAAVPSRVRPGEVVLDQPQLTGEPPRPGIGYAPRIPRERRLTPPGMRVTPQGQAEVPGKGKVLPPLRDEPFVPTWRNDVRPFMQERGTAVTPGTTAPPPPTPEGPRPMLTFRGEGRGRPNPIPDRGTIPMREMPPANRQIPYQTRALPPPGERIPEERRLTPPAFRPEMKGGGLKVRRRQALPPITEPYRETPEGLRPYIVEKGVAKQPGSSIDPPWTPLRWMLSAKESLAEAEQAPAQVRALLREHAADAKTADKMTRGYVEQPTSTPFNPFTLPPEGYKRYHEIIDEIRRIRDAHLPSRETLDAAPFGARLKRQQDMDFARAATEFRKRGFTSTDRQAWWANRLAYNELKPGMDVITPYGPGKVLRKTESGAGARSIARLAAGRGEHENAGYTSVPATTATVKLDSGEEVKLGAQNILRIEHETNYAAEIPQGYEHAPFKRAPRRFWERPGYKPTTRRATPAAPEETEAETDPERFDDDFDWSTGEFIPPKK